ncbi:MAG: CRISPR-associated endonuclease Cas1, partial [Anaerolineae bacterium]
MPPLYIVEQGALVRSAGRRLVVEKDGQELRSVPLEQVDEVVIFGHATLTTPAMKLLLFEGVDTVFLTLDGLYCGRLVGPLSKHGSLRREQYARSMQSDFALAVARACVSGKLRNMRALLMRYQRMLNLPELAQAAAQIETLIARAEAAANNASLMGVEGAASAAYFGVFARLLKRDWGFVKRARRPPLDPVNVLLSFGYTLLAKHL